MTDCVIAQPIHPAGLALLRRAGLTVFEAASPDLAGMGPHLATARAVVTRDRGLGAAEIAAAPRLELIASHGTGTDRIDRAAAERRGIRIANTPGTNAASVAEHALALIFACSRRVVAADRALRDGRWAYRDAAHPLELAGKRLGLVGYGHVARRLAEMAAALGLSVVVYSSWAEASELERVGARRAESLEQVLATADIVSLHGKPGVAPVIDAAALAAMRPGAILINTARGALVDEAALADALRAGRISAGLDVFAQEPLPALSPLRDCPNLVLTPHMGGAGQQAQERTALAVARLVIEGLGFRLPDADAGPCPAIAP